VAEAAQCSDRSLLERALVDVAHERHVNLHDIDGSLDRISASTPNGAPFGHAVGQGSRLERLRRVRRDVLR
jgi:hypothetical protein